MKNRLLKMLTAIVLTTVMVLSAIPVFTVGAEGEQTYTKVDLADITPTDEIIIVSTKGDANYAMSNDKGTGSAPVAVSVTVSNNTITTDAANILWNISKVGDNLTIYQNGTTKSWLYCTNTNNGVRVGTNTNKVFTIDSASGYLKHTGTNRYLGVYNSQDWRCYTNTTGNTVGQTFSFYKKADSTCAHTKTENVAEVPATCTENGTAAGVKCTDCGAKISGFDTIPALNHNWENDACTRCDAKILTIPEVLAVDDNTEVTVCGTVHTIGTAWSDTYNNISVYIADEEGNELYLFRLATKVEVGDIIRVTGVKTTYKGTIELDAGATAEILGAVPVLNSVSLDLNKGVTVNVTYAIPEAWLAENTGAKVVFSTGKEIDAVAGENVYSVDLTPAKINDALTVEIKAADGTVLVTATDVSVATYKAKAEAAGYTALGISEAKFNALIALIDATVKYSNAADGSIEENLTNDFAGAAGTNVIHGNPEKILFTGYRGTFSTYASVSIGVNTANIQDGDTLLIKIKDIEKYNGDLAAKVFDGQIVIDEMYPADFNEEIYIEAINEKSKATFTFNSYLKAVYEASNSSQNVKNFAVAAYEYGLAAEAYISAS